MNFEYLNDSYKKALSAWVDELFAGKESFLFDTRLAAEEDYFGDQASEFWGYLTQAENCRMVEIYHHEDGPHMLDVRRPNGNHRWGSIQQIELAMLYGKLESFRYFAKSDDRYTFSFTRKDPNPNSESSSICQAEREWPTLKTCRDAIDKILRLNPAHSVEVTDVTLGPNFKEQADAELMAEKLASLDRPIGLYPAARRVMYIDTPTIISPYLERHRPQNQHQVEGFPFNPRLRHGFDSADHRNRDPFELQDWLDRPYIITESWDETEQRIRRHRDNAQRKSNESEDDAFERQLADQKDQWFASYPEGTRYQVRCLDGGAWDRSSSWGFFPSHDAAIAHARTGPEQWETLKKTRSLGRPGLDPTDQ